jgi:competence protein ComEC
MLSENGGIDGEPMLLADQASARCSPDACTADLRGAGRSWRLLATRSGYPVAWQALVAVCRSADIVVSDRRLPNGCVPRWLKLDAAALRRTGGVAVTLARGEVRTVRPPGDRHPWITPPTIMPARVAISGERRGAWVARRAARERGRTR